MLNQHTWADIMWVDGLIVEWKYILISGYHPSFSLPSCRKYQSYFLFDVLIITTQIPPLVYLKLFGIIYLFVCPHVYRENEIAKTESSVPKSASELEEFVFNKSNSRVSTSQS